jgi:DNA-binding HxlR family transcriptional regulator
MPKLKDESIKYRILMLLVNGDKRFTDLLSDIKRATLSNELRELEHYKLIKRSVDNKSRPPKVTYSITDKGRQTLAAKAAILIKAMEETVALLRRIPVSGANTATIDTNDPLARSVVNGMIATSLE